MFKNIISDTYDESVFNSTPRKIFYGVNNVAKRVKAVYIGSRGLAKKLIYEFKKDFVFKETIQAAYSTGNIMASNDDYLYQCDNTNTVCAYDDQFTYSELEIVATTTASANRGSSYNEQYVLFGGGRSSQEVTAYDEYNVATLCNNNLDAPRGYRNYVGSGNVGDYACFIGGYGQRPQSSAGYWEAISQMDCYDDTLTKTNATTNPSYNTKADKLNDKLYIGGGQNYDTSPNMAIYNTVCIYNSELSRVGTSALSSSKTGICTQHTKKHVIFAGGGDSKVDALDEYYTKTALNDLLASASSLLGVSSEGLAIFAGINGNSIECYDSRLVHSIKEPLSTSKSGIYGGAMFKDKATFTGAGTIDIYEFV